MNPCMRKSTNPLPVFAPPTRSASSTVGEIIEELVALNACCVENPSVNVAIQKRKGGDEANFNLPCKKLKLRNILEEDLTLSEEEGGCKNKPKVWKLARLDDPRKGKSGDYLHLEKGQKYKSKEIISDSEDSGEEKSKTEESCTSKTSNKEGGMFKKQLKFTSPLPIKGEKRCKYIFKNKPRKGVRCEQVSKEDLCSTHKKLPCQINSVNPVDKVKKELLELKRLYEEKDVENVKTIRNLEKEIQTLKQSLRDAQSSIQELDNKLEHILNKESAASLVTLTSRKITKLNRKESYTLVKRLGVDGIFKCESGTFKMKIPQGLENSKPGENGILKFNHSTAKFEWSNV